MLRRFVAAVLFALTAMVVGATPASASIGWFDFKRITNTNSTLWFKWSDNTNPELVQSSPGWRAGSGDSTACGYINHGWLPVGWYDGWGHWNNYDSLIKGRVFWVQDKRCGDGTLRTELFIHTEETAANGQSCPTAGDDPYCWEAVYDYNSGGCIKVAYPNNGFSDIIGQAHWYWHNRYGGSGHGTNPNPVHKLYVHD